ncbi:hypothetical protein Desgi_3431 [Desulfoscipio gibsoniae DSM 7213]|uniref:Glycosyltransferase n=2 Tax=Desulfoscipio gibsoniae TaxID=102134 RepID=R4KJH1_9FIRM|nr:hypothetical protein Desgi_3431 [Desulfoscipio gibsoniae DSM 7213]
MKFCLVSQTPPSDLELKDVNRVTQWATVMQGAHYNGLAFDNGDYDLPYEYFSEFDLVMVAIRLETIEIGLKIKRQSTARVLVFLDGEMEHFISHLPGDKLVRLIELINLADGVGVTHEYSIPVVRGLTTKPVGMIGVPFPLKRVREELCPPVEKKQAIHVGCGTGKSFNRNGIVNLSALAEIGLPGVVDVWGPEDIEYVRLIKKYIPIPPIYFSHTPRWEDYVVQLNNSFLGLHLDYRQIWGRFALDCAAVRMPCIAPDNFYTQKTLFPRLCVNYQDIDRTVKLAQKLIKNNSFYEETISYAESQLAFFSNEAAKERLLNLVS